MIVEEIMTTDVVVVKKGATVKEAISAIVNFQVGCVLVVKGNEALGIITERDILMKVVNAGKDPRLLKVEDVMSKPLITIEPDATVEKASKMLNKYKIKKLPVVDGDELIGIVTASDIIANEPKHVEHLAKLILKPTATVAG